MTLFKKSKTLTEHLKKLRIKKALVGFVPTMGALHNGHISLIKKAKEVCDIVVCSIFINPTQFNNKNDFEKYPVTIENDILLLETNKTDILFLPSIDEIYPGGTESLAHFELGNLEHILEGYFRPGHFQGVCNVVHRLLTIVMPDRLLLGQKDYQQILVLRNMIETFHSNTEISVQETLRENDGLAMSSRNMRLNNDARKKATAIYETLQYIKQNIKKNNFESLLQHAKETILNNGFNKVDYLEICDAKTLLPVDSYVGDKKLISLAAAFIDDVRLIDNILL